MAVMKSTAKGWVRNVPSREPREWASRVLLRLALRVSFMDECRVSSATDMGRPCDLNGLVD
ncbi:UNVERIFIED_CONTAM: hypothetical protein Sradi_1534800 [Sesamum radiatum]|uniref:Uncharacterized protein n=1 Tax=Sesamum radiatum TaxID=300843 RepID=A0AAW2U7M1_SESRA